MAPLALGCMRLSTEPDRDDARSIAVLHTAFDAGITHFDTADAYCLDAADIGHNERLLARARNSWPGNKSRIRIATKGGLTRPLGEWLPDGRAKHLLAACEASRAALGVERIDLYQLHVPDPKTPLATSVRALAALQHKGLIGSVGLCNVTVGQIEEARSIVSIAAVQVELSLWHDDNILNGVVEYCAVNDIPLFAYRPLGGTRRLPRVRDDSTLQSIAGKHGGTPYEIAIAWLQRFPGVTPLIGATRVATIASLARTMALALDDDDIAQLDEQFPGGRALRLRSLSRAPMIQPQQSGEVVLVVGIPGAGKSTAAESFSELGYTRLNRDEAGGSLAGLLPRLEHLIASGTTRIVLDNTYVSRKARAEVIGIAARHGLAVRVVWLATTIEDAQVNAATRIVKRFGRLLDPEELRAAAKSDTAAFGPGVQFRYQRELEPPQADEGFSGIDAVAFERRPEVGFEGKALILWCDGVLRRSRSGQRTPVSADDVEILPERATVLRRYREEGWPLLGLSWHPEIAERTMGAEDVRATFVRMQELLGVEIEVELCPHAAGPPICWCRKPLPGLGVVFIERHKLDPAQCVYVGNGPQDPGFARRLGFQYREAREFFGDTR